MAVPRSREEAKGTEYEPLWQTPQHWPDHVHKIPINAFENMGIDGHNRLYWDGVPIVTKNTVRLEGWSFVLALIATISAAIAAGWPIAVNLGWFGLPIAP
ncbi:MAG: hypothetical protein ACOH2N_14405 [Devosia sp.]